MKPNKEVCLNCAEAWLKECIQKHPEMEAPVLFSLKQQQMTIRERLAHVEDGQTNCTICYAFTKHRDFNRIFIEHPNGEIPDECPHVEKHRLKAANA